MSGIAGIFNLDGRPADPALLRRMTDRIAHRGPDGIGHWTDGPVALGHCMLWTTPEALQEKQPLANETGDLCLTMDGRVDNREELRTAIEAAGLRLRADTDAELVLRAYERWGEACPEKIIGDFAFAIWDQRKRRLFCARDPLGVKPFYYHANGSALRWGSELRVVLDSLDETPSPNLGFIAEYLTGDLVTEEETIWQAIMRLRPGHTLTVTPDRTAARRYFALDPTRDIRYATDTEYAEHFLAVFTEAVRCRLRSHAPVGAHLSGGLDSSSVAVLAHQLAGVEAYSLVFPGLPCDESVYIDEVERARGLTVHRIAPAPAGPQHYIDQVRRYRDLPDCPNGVMHEPLKALAWEAGVRVMLTGLGGDEWLAGSPRHYADLLRGLALRRAIRQARSDPRLGARGDGTVPWPGLLKAGLAPLLPDPALRLARRLAGRPLVPPWVRPSFARQTTLTRRLARPAPASFRDHARRALYGDLACGWQTHALEMTERSASWASVEERHPLHDVRIISLMAALPEEQRWRDGRSKPVLRSAMRDLLPSAISERTSKAEFTAVFLPAFRAIAAAGGLDSLWAEALGWLDSAPFRAAYGRMTASEAPGTDRRPHLWPLWNAVATELWQRHAVGRTGPGAEGETP